MSGEDEIEMWTGKRRPENGDSRPTHPQNPCGFFFPSTLSQRLGSFLAPPEIKAVLTSGNRNDVPNDGPRSGQITIFLQGTRDTITTYSITQSFKQQNEKTFGSICPSARAAKIESRGQSALAGGQCKSKRKLRWLAYLPCVFTQ